MSAFAGLRFRNSLRSPQPKLDTSDKAQLMLAGQVAASVRPAGRSRCFLGLGELVSVALEFRGQGSPGHGRCPCYRSVAKGEKPLHLKDTIWENEVKRIPN